MGKRARLSATVVAALAVTLGACGTADTPTHMTTPEIAATEQPASSVTLEAVAGAPEDPVLAKDCSAADYDSSGDPVRPECRITLATSTLIGDSQWSWLVAQTQFHGEAEFTATGLMPEQFATLDEAFAGFTEMAEMNNDEQWIQIPVCGRLTSLSTSHMQGATPSSSPDLSSIPTVFRTETL